MSRQRVLFVQNSGRIMGGGQVSLLALMQQLDRQSFTPLCVGPDEGSMTDAVRRCGIPVRVVAQPPLRPGGLAAVARAAWALRGLVRDQQVDLIHANGSRCMFYAGVAGRLTGVPVVWHVRVADADGSWDRVLAALAARIIVISRAVEARFVPLRRAAQRLRVVHNGVDLHVFAQADGAGLRRRLGYGDQVLVGMVAQLIPWKRHPDFIRAMSTVAAAHPEARFLVVGADPEPGARYQLELQDLALQSGLGDRLVFTGFRDDVAEIMAMLDIVVLTSENEPFGRVLIEAMAASRPVVATRGGGVEEIVQHDRTGLLVPVGDTAALAAAVSSLLEQPAKRLALGRAGQERAQGRFGIAAHARAVERVYREILEGQRPGGDCRE